jgi:hypothetical protein
MEKQSRKLPEKFAPVVVNQGPRGRCVLMRLSFRGNFSTKLLTTGRFPLKNSLRPLLLIQKYFRLKVKKIFDNLNVIPALKYPRNQII